MKYIHENSNRTNFIWDSDIIMPKLGKVRDMQGRLLGKMDGFDGKLTTSKWAKINKCSQDTALRDIQDLINKNILERAGGGRSTSYKLNDLPA